MTFLIAFLCILILIILTILLLRDHRTPWTRSNHLRGSVRRASGFVLTGKLELENSMGGGATMNLPGETEAGSAGRQPCRGITGRAHRADVQPRGSQSSRAVHCEEKAIGR
jgi:hypothetical protein